jgi:hypothetical protein
MTESLANHFGILIRSEQESRAAMSQVVKAQCCGQLGTFEDRLEMLLNDIQSD